MYTNKNLLIVSGMTMLIPLKNDSIARHFDGHWTLASTLPLPTIPSLHAVRARPALPVIAEPVLIPENYGAFANTFS